ncbi:MAG: hypothetical protein LH473_04090, partial [Chitinophagales bacterium]|nr:hypothetical protein [Chitinophagales bacterium]
GSGVIVLLGASIQKQKAISFRGIEINIDESNGNFFISKNDVLQILRDNRVNFKSAKPAAAINYRQLEQVLENNPYVEHAEIYTDANEKITINIQQRTPVLRIINNQSVSYYLDNHGKRMPLSSNFTARVQVATGFIFTNADHQSIADSITEKNLFVLADFIQRDSFLSSLTEQIIINKQNEIEIIPMIGNHSILIGDTENLNEKFDRLKIFYRETIGHVNLNQYSMINLKYDNKIYCVRRGVEATINSSTINLNSN